MAEFTVNLAALTPELARSVRAGFEFEDVVKYRLGLVEQARLKQLADRLAVPGMNTDLGRHDLVLSRNQWLQCLRRYGTQCFADPEFAPWLKKTNEDFRVKDVGTRIQSGFTGKGDTLRRG